MVSTCRPSVILELGINPGTVKSWIVDIRIPMESYSCTALAQGVPTIITSGHGQHYIIQNDPKPKGFELVISEKLSTLYQLYAHK